MNKLFVYGSLMCDDILHDVTGDVLRAEPAILVNYARYKVINEYYPAIVYRQGMQVEGKLYHEVSDTAWQRLDSFEGDMYNRQTVRVNVSKNNLVYANTYVIHPEYQNMLHNELWCYEEFRRRHKQRFRKQYQGFGMVEKG